MFILVCKQEISFSNDFGCYMSAAVPIVFELEDQNEGETVAMFLIRNQYITGLKPLRIMYENDILKEYNNENS